MLSADQYNALRSASGFLELSDWSSVTLTGADRQKFLNNFCTNDVKRLTPGTSCEAFLTNVKGKILGHALVTCREHELVLVTVPGQSPKLIEHLDRYLIREDVQLRDTTAERSWLLVAGSQTAGKVLQQLEKTGVLVWNWQLIDADVCSLIEVPLEELAELRKRLLDQGATSCAEFAFTIARIEAGTPLFGLDFDENNFPQEVGRDAQAISFTKGCYLGQETVARIDALGHVNQQIVGVRFSGSELPSHGSELSHDGKPAGHVGSAAFSPQLAAPLALAMVRRELTAPGSQLDSPLGPCEVVGLPLAAG